jgi:hypothetical protein
MPFDEQRDADKAIMIVFLLIVVATALVVGGGIGIYVFLTH